MAIQRNKGVLPNCVTLFYFTMHSKIAQNVSVKRPQSFSDGLKLKKGMCVLIFDFRKHVNHFNSAVFVFCIR